MVVGHRVWMPVFWLTLAVEPVAGPEAAQGNTVDENGIAHQTLHFTPNIVYAREGREH